MPVTAQVQSSLTRQLRKLIGRGKTSYDRGAVWMDIENTKEAWEDAKARLTAEFGEGVEDAPDGFITRYNTPVGVEIRLKRYRAGENNFLVFTVIP